jgi:hypothetical protein
LFSADPGGIGSAFHRAEEGGKQKDSSLREKEVFLISMGQYYLTIIDLLVKNRKSLENVIFRFIGESSKFNYFWMPDQSLPWT